MNPPIKGAIRVPKYNVQIKHEIASPRICVEKISANIAGETAIWQAPLKPAKKRQMRMVWASLAVAIATEKAVNAKEERRKGRRRPWSSERGAQRIGPDAKPSTYREIPRVEISGVIEKWVAMEGIAGA